MKHIYITKYKDKNYEAISHSLLSKIKKNTIVFDAWQMLYEKLINDKNIIYRYV